PLAVHGTRARRSEPFVVPPPLPSRISGQPATTRSRSGATYRASAHAGVRTSVRLPLADSKRTEVRTPAGQRERMSTPNRPQHPAGARDTGTHAPDHRTLSTAPLATPPRSAPAPR